MAAEEWRWSRSASSRKQCQGWLKFGGVDGVVPLHPLDAPFSDSVGPRLAASLRFQGDSTIADAPVAQLMEGLGHMLDQARHGIGAGGIGAGTQDLNQLVIILADGRFHERESLKAAVREVAARPGVCLAFLALDSSATDGGSLMDMQTVSFQGCSGTWRRCLRRWLGY
jgi:midasin